MGTRQNEGIYGLNRLAFAADDLGSHDDRAVFQDWLWG